MSTRKGKLQGVGNAPHKRGPGRPPRAAASLEELVQEAQAARQEFERISAQRERVAQSIRTIGHVYHVVDLERGVRRNGRLIAADIREQIGIIRSVAQHEGLTQTCLDRIDKAERVVPKMQATIGFVSGYVRQQVRQLVLPPPVSIPTADAPLAPSKSQRKRDAHALQALGVQLIALSAAQLARLDLPEILHEAVVAAQRMRAHGARTRQIQYIGKLLRQLELSVLSRLRAALESGPAGTPRPQP